MERQEKLDMTSHEEKENAQNPETLALSLACLLLPENTQTALQSAFERVQQVHWLQPSQDPSFEDATQQIERHLQLLRDAFQREVHAPVATFASTVDACLSRFETLDVLLQVAKQAGSAAYLQYSGNAPQVGRAVWQALVEYAKTSETWVLWESAREVAAEVSREAIREGSGAGFAARELCQEAAAAASLASVESHPYFAAIETARRHATEAVLTEPTSGAAIDAAMDLASHTGRYISQRLHLASQQAEISSVVWELTRDAARDISWYASWSVVPQMENPWSPLLSIWAMGYGVFRLIDGRFLVYAPLLKSANVTVR